MSLTCLDGALGVRSRILAAQAAASLFERKDCSHCDAYAENGSTNGDDAMRIFERLRLNFGFMPIEPKIDSEEQRELTDAAAAIPILAAATEGMCCGHCSGKLEGHTPELPTAR